MMCGVIKLIQYLDTTTIRHSLERLKVGLCKLWRSTFRVSPLVETCKNGVYALMASKQQIPKLAGSLVEHQGAFAALSNEDIQWAINETKQAIGLFVDSVRNRGKEQRSFKRIGSTHAPGCSAFNARTLVAGYNIGGVTVRSVSDKFQRNLGLLVERNIPKISLDVYEITTGVGGSISRGSNGLEMYLGNIVELLRLEASGNWVLINRKDPNYFYVRNEKQTGWVIELVWNGGWNFHALDPDLVFDRKPLGLHFYPAEAI